MAQELADCGVKRQAKCERISITFYDTLKSKERQSKSSKVSRDLMVLIKSLAKQEIIYFKIEDIQLSRAPARVQQDEEPQEHVVLLLVARMCIVCQVNPPPRKKRSGSWFRNIQDKEAQELGTGFPFAFTSLSRIRIVYQVIYDRGPRRSPQAITKQLGRASVLQLVKAIAISAFASRVPLVVVAFMDSQR